MNRKKKVRDMMSDVKKKRRKKNENVSDVNMF